MQYFSEKIVKYNISFSPKFPAESISKKLDAKADVTTPGRSDEKTSLIIGFATLKSPIPPVATQKKVVPRR